MKKLTSKQIFLIIGGVSLAAIIVVIIVLLIPKTGPDGCGSGYKCKKPGHKLYGKCIKPDYCGNLKDNMPNCDCTIECSKKGEQPFPPSVKPKGEIQCGTECQDATSTAYSEASLPVPKGTGYCLHGDYCGKEITSKSSIPEYSGCFDPTNFSPCSTPGGPVLSYCQKIPNLCNTETGYCLPGKYCNKVKACVNNNECVDEEGTQGTCKPKFADFSPANPVGHCISPSTLYFDSSNNCTDEEKIGSSYEKIGSYELKICTKKEIGVDGKLQCTDLEGGCAPIKCPNNWQGSFDEGGCSPSPTPINTEKIPCCKQKHIIKDPNGDWCCSTVGTTDCSNETDHGYSKKLLGLGGPGLPVENHLPCGNDTDCTTYNTNLISSLTTPDFAPTDKPRDSKYVTLYCDGASVGNKGDGVCKAKCGYTDENTPSFSEQTNVAYENNYITENVTNPSQPENSYSYCITTKDKNCTITGDGNYEHGTFNNIPVCKSDSDEKLYWAPLVGENAAANYTTSKEFTITGECSKTMKAALCEKEAEYVSGSNSTDYNENTGLCTIKIDCNNSKVEPTGYGLMNWTDLLNGKWASSGTDDPTNKVIQELPYKYNPPVSSANENEKKMCTGVNGKIPISATKSGYEYITSGCTPVNTFNTGIQGLLSGEYCPTGVQLNEKPPPGDPGYSCNNYE